MFNFLSCSEPQVEDKNSSYYSGEDDHVPPTDLRNLLSHDHQRKAALASYAADTFVYREEDLLSLRRSILCPAPAPEWGFSLETESSHSETQSDEDPNAIRPHLTIAAFTGRSQRAMDGAMLQSDEPPFHVRNMDFIRRMEFLLPIGGIETGNRKTVYDVENSTQSGVGDMVEEIVKRGLIGSADDFGLDVSNRRELVF